MPWFEPKQTSPLAVARLRPDEDRQRHQVIAPDAVVFESQPVVPPTGRIEVKFVRTDGDALHGFFEGAK